MQESLLYASQQIKNWNVFRPEAEGWANGVRNIRSVLDSTGFREMFIT